MAKLTVLAHLVLSGNRFVDMPDVIFKLVKLETLTMQKNGLRRVPAISGLPCLRELDLFMNRIDDMDAQFGCGLTSLSALLLRANRLAKLPDALALHVPTLTHVDLSSNPLVRIPACLVQLARLATLECVSCELDSLAALGDAAHCPMLATLQLLNVSHNGSIADLPALVMPMLTDFRAAACGIVSVTETTFAQCPRLRFVDLDDNPLNTCWFAAHLTELDKVALCRAPLTAPLIVPHGACLSELVLADTNMQQVPLALARACGATLRRIYMQRNGIERVDPEALGAFVRLEELSLRENRLQTLCVPTAALANLRSLDLALNSVASLPDELFLAMPQLQRLDLACNRLTRLPTSLWECCRELSTLNVFSNALKAIPPRIEALTCLRELFAGNNQIATFPSEAAVALTALRVLHLAGNALSTLPAAMALPRLEKLYMGRNDFRTFPDCFQRCGALDTLDMSGNHMTSFVVTGTFPCLQELILSHNRLNAFETRSAGGQGAAADNSFPIVFPAIVCLDLSDNPIEHVPAFGNSGTLEIVNLLHCGIQQLTPKQQSDISNVRLLYMQGNPIERSSRPSRALRLSFVEHRTDLIVSDLRKPAFFPRFGGGAPAAAATYHGMADADIIGVAWSEIKGGRTTQEDAITIMERKDGNDDSEHLFGVFDGHRGPEVSQYCATHFPFLLKHAIQAAPDDPARAVTAAFHNLSRSIERNGLKAGATAAIALVQARHITLAHVGDARAVVYSTLTPEHPPSPEQPLKHSSKTILKGTYGDVVAVATRDHTAKNRIERRRIERDLGGYVSEHGRVMGDIAVTRALGDGQFSPFITNDPSIMVVPRVGAELCLIVACDGLWDVVTVEQAYTLVAAHMEDLSADPAQVALMLRDYAFSMGSTDNISVVVVSNLAGSAKQ